MSEGATTTAEIIAFCDRLLEPDRYRDYCPNGLQVPGPEHVHTVVTGVSAHAELFEAAVTEDADLVLAHHGIFWKGQPQAISPAFKRKLQLLFDADIALAAYHLPLDGHAEIGNNALLADALGCVAHAPFAQHEGTPIGVVGDFGEDGVAPTDLVARVREVCFGREPLAFLEGPERIRRIGIVSGAAIDYVGDAVAAGLDAFLTGEPAERVMAQAREERIHVLAAGHYATEVRGIRRLGELLAERFGVRHVFVDVPNPI
ncbi:MAG: Nif3-like dinuclear metal center hexameric protein [Solirubrobacteraceae bacterium]|nr:Nif3-like dinuclear metal center hexameric protein [Solirubrobacteraceae bacterium]